ncbi:MAG: hypothetical protein NTY00_02890 [Deltaproteobacteria bacterium]|nr:hypothetical protein [Deltaproteobacteria bacterium]
MQKLLFGIFFLVLVLVFPLSTRARVGVGINISLPVPIVFVAPPELIVLPETDVYVVPDVEADIFFYNGWWWRPWEGHWYRSRSYDSGWSYYRRVPSFYRQIPSDWRSDYREHRWRGNQWDYQQIPYPQVQQNWSGWQKSGYWEKQQTWGVQGLQPRMRSQQYRGAGQKFQKSQPQHSQQQYRGAGQKFRQAKPQHSQQQYRGAGQKLQKSQPQHSQQQSRGAGQKFQKAQPQHQQGKQKGGKGGGKGNN